MICACCGKEFKPAAPSHRIICGDSREEGAVALLFDGTKANMAITSPPYASQRTYDETSGFKPVHPDDYVEWFSAVASAIEKVLEHDGSYFLNIKEHANDGERSLYVKDLVIAHKRIWGWRFVDEFCWRNTGNGVPGVWPDRFKNAWEPVFHFTRAKGFKFNPRAVRMESARCIEYTPGVPSSNSGSGLLCVGATEVAGLALPSNVLDVAAERSQGSHSAPFPRALVEFFVKAFSDAGDVVFDPFMGSGTTIAAAHVLGRNGYGCEISPLYCDVIVLRIQALTGKPARLAADGRTFAQVEKDRKL